jgi:hypothetical protein
VIEGLAPSRLPGDRFRHVLGEDPRDFGAQAAHDPAGSLRRFQVRHNGRMWPPRVSNTDYIEREVTFIVRIAYPQNARAGSRWERDRDDAVELDALAIDAAIGIHGRANFLPELGADAMPLGCEVTRLVAAGNDLLELRATFVYQSAV